MMMFIDGPINSQEYTSKKNNMNKRSGSPFIIIQLACLWEEMSKINLFTCLFSLFEALNGAVEVHFLSRLHLYTISKTLHAGTCSSYFLK